jgi:hypothetical protein
MAKDRKPLPTIADVDATDKVALSSTVMPNPNKKPVKRSRRLIPAWVEDKPDPDPEREGQKLLINHPTSVVGTLDHITNPLLARKPSMDCQYMGAHNVGSTFSICGYPATHHVRDTARPRGSVLGLCTTHKAKVEHEAIKTGRNLEVGKLTPKNTEEIKKVQSIDAEKTNWKVAATLSDQGVPREDALDFNMANSPGGVAHNRKEEQPLLGTAPTMGDQEAADYNATRLREKKGKTSPIEGIDLFVEPRGGAGSETQVKMGKTTPKTKEKDAPIGQGTGIIDTVHNMYKAGDSNWESLAQQHGIHRSLITGLGSRRKPSKYFTDQVLYTEAPERLDKAISKVSDEQSDEVISAYTDNAQAKKQRQVEMLRRGIPNVKPGGLPMRRNSAFELGSGETKSLGSGETKSLEPPK